MAYGRDQIRLTPLFYILFLFIAVLAVTVRGKELQFWYSLLGEEGDGELGKIGPVFDASILSDECGGHAQHGSFTGAFVGVACSDLNGLVKKAVFDYFVYRPVHFETDRYELRTA